MAENKTTVERLAGLEAKWDASNEYQHQRWHELNNNLQPIFMLPEKLVREISTLQGNMQGQLTTALVSFEQAMERALAPILEDINKLKEDVDELKAEKNKTDGAKGLGKALMNSPFLGGIIGALFTLGMMVIAFFKVGAK